MPGAPTLTSVAPTQGIRGTTVAVTLTGTNFVVGATTVAVTGGGVTVNTVVVGSTTSLTANFVLDLAATPGGRTVTVTTADGTSGPQTFTVGLLAPTLTNVAPNQGTRATTVAVTLTGTNFVVGATTVAVSGAGVAVNNIVVGSITSLTANFVLDPAAAVGPRAVTVTTACGTSGGQPFTINPGTAPFIFTGGPQTFTVPPLVTTLTVTAQGAQGGFGSPGGLGGSVIATLTVVPGEILNVFVGGQGGLVPLGGLGGFNGGGAGGTGAGFHDGGGGGASDIRRGGSALSNRVVVAGGGGGGSFSGFGGAGGGTTGGAGSAPAQRDRRWRWHAVGRWSGGSEHLEPCQQWSARGVRHRRRGRTRRVKWVSRRRRRWRLLRRRRRRWRHPSRLRDWWRWIVVPGSGATHMPASVHTARSTVSW